MTKKIGSCIIAATLIVAAAMALGPTTTAQAGTIIDLTCSASFQFDFIPRLTPTVTRSKATLRGSALGCNGPASEEPDGLSSATAKGTGEATSSPIVCNLLLTIKGVGSLVWNTDEVSEFDYTVNTNPPNGPITLSAFITSGRLAGDTITAVPLSAHPNPDCALNGLSRLTSEASLVTFTH